MRLRGAENTRAGGPYNEVQRFRHKMANKLHTAGSSGKNTNVCVVICACVLVRGDVSIVKTYRLTRDVFRHNHQPKLWLASLRAAEEPRRLQLCRVVCDLSVHYLRSFCPRSFFCKSSLVSGGQWRRSSLLCLFRFRVWCATCHFTRVAGRRPRAR